MLPYHKPFLLPSGNLAVSAFIIGFWTHVIYDWKSFENWKETRHYEFTLRRMSAAVANFPFALSTWDQPHVCVWLFTHFRACISPFLFIPRWRHAGQIGQADGNTLEQDTSPYQTANFSSDLCWILYTEQKSNVLWMLYKYWKLFLACKHPNNTVVSVADPMRNVS